MDYGLTPTSKNGSPKWNKDLFLNIITPVSEKNLDLHHSLHSSSIPKAKVKVKRMAEKRPRSRQIPVVHDSLPVKQCISESPKLSQTEAVVEEEKVPKKGVHSKASRPFSLRKDVVYKTLIRSLKRFLTEKCNPEIPSFWTKEQKETAHFEQIEILFDKYYSDAFNENSKNRSLKVIIHDREFMRLDASNKFDPENLKIYLCLLVFPEMIKAYLKNQKRRCQQKLIYDCLYKYSHKKLDKLLQSEFFTFLFKDYVKSGSFHKMMNSDETLRKHKDTYQQASEYFLSKMSE